MDFFRYFRKPVLILVQVDDDNFPRIEEARDRTGSSICKSPGNNQPSVRALEDTAGIAGQDSLAGRVEALSEQANLSAVGMAGQDQIDGMISQHGCLQTPVFRMVAEQYFIAVLLLKRPKPSH